MAGSSELSEREQLTAVVFGDTFALYDDASFEEFLEPLYLRLERNGIARDVFAGKRCLDAGCGGGRGSVLMAEAGAAEVVGVDLSERNVESSRRRAEARGLRNCTFVQSSLMEIPFEDESFDVVWCNGVLHHTTHPDKGLQEITRVLRTGGRLWLYLYGSGGVYWYLVDWIREQLRDVHVVDAIYLLRLMDMPIRRIAEWMDDWFVPYLRRYTEADVSRRLAELGYGDVELLARGTVYDTSHRRVGASATESALMGEGDLRYFARKAGPPAGEGARLPDPPDGKGSPYDDGPEVKRFSPRLAAIADELAQLEERLGHHAAAERIVVCRAVHTAARDLLEQEGEFDVVALEQRLADLAPIVGQLHTAERV